jgi:SRSO17 transposase
MEFLFDAQGARRLGDFMSSLGSLLGNEQRRASFALYATGLLGDSERKSMEPIAARACPNPKRLDAQHQRLHHFITCSKWKDGPVREFAARYAIDALTEREPIEVCILDDTGMLKQGKHSVGVQRQYTGTAGKITNCQLAVSLSVATATEHLPIDFELYLPRSWTDDDARRREAGIPAEVTFKTKIELAIDMLERAASANIPLGVLLADSFYGRASELRVKARSLGLEYVLAIDSDTLVEPIGKNGKLKAATRVDALAKDKRYRSFTWLQGSKAPLCSRFAFEQVRLPEGQIATLIFEWEQDKPKPNKFAVAVLDKKRSKKQLLRLLKQRWRTERVYEDLKGELGFDHFEGRRYRGFNHHVSVALCCFAFVVAERVRCFSPQSRRPSLSQSFAIAA